MALLLVPRGLAAAGRVVQAPHIVCSPPGVGTDRVRLDRLARMSARSLLGFEMFELSRMVDYLQTRAEVIPDRTGMYGISPSGKQPLSLAEEDKLNPRAAPLWPDHVLASLICPRPFTVEAGRYDPVIDWRDIRAEFELVQEIYRRLGLDERAEITVADRGGHEMLYDGPIRFLDRWLGAA